MPKIWRGSSRSKSTVDRPTGARHDFIEANIGDPDPSPRIRSQLPAGYRRVSAPCSRTERHG